MTASVEWRARGREDTPDEADFKNLRKWAVKKVE